MTFWMQPTAHWSASGYPASVPKIKLGAFQPRKIHFEPFNPVLIVLQRRRLAAGGQNVDVFILTFMQSAHFDQNTGDLGQSLHEIYIV